jgi:stage II sporulation protein AA (anti-sigma F factor antagonist)
MILHLAKHQIKPGITVIEMKGSIHAGTDCRRLENETATLIADKVNRVIFDFTHITHIDSSAIGSLVRSHTELKKAGGSLRLAGVKGMLEGTLKMTKVDKLVEIFPTAPSAAENFVVSSISDPTSPA